MIQVKVFGVAIDPVTKGFVVILKDQDEKKWLPIWIGPYEAKMISMALEKTKPNRPFSPDLIKNIIESAELFIEKIVISDIRDNTYYATIWLRKGEKQLLIDARPSDAIAIALRLESPIFIADEVMKKASVVHSSKEEENAVRLAQLKNELQIEVDRENYEKAAQIRDEIKRLEKISNIPPLKPN
ncbi:MAG: bifunctional nuclease family protein [Atribacterota bacterium]|nr:bifunctional nuclease family protein [Atribacterota bacterium]MDD5637549.1 bifunctional nuclease family protein [Atribacterota bacterium]